MSDPAGYGAIMREGEALLEGVILLEEVSPEGMHCVRCAKAGDRICS